MYFLNISDTGAWLEGAEVWYNRNKGSTHTYTHTHTQKKEKIKKRRRKNDSTARTQI